MLEKLDKEKPINLNGESVLVAVLQSPCVLEMVSKGDKGNKP